MADMDKQRHEAAVDRLSNGGAVKVIELPDSAKKKPKKTTAAD